MGVVSSNENQVYDWLQEGWSAYKISKELGCASSSVKGFMDRRGWKSKHKPTQDGTNLLKDKQEEVIRLHNEGKSQNEIGEALGHSGGAICILLKKLGIEAHDFTYNVDEAYFDKIDTNAKAYILGWFYSDGCVDLKGKMRIQIQREDKYVLEWIKKEMGYDGPLYDVPPPKKFPHRKPQACLCINRKPLADSLIKLGCNPNKSLTVTFPTTKQVPKKYWPSFMLGVYDGDGSISLKKDKYIQTSITCTEEFLMFAREHIYKPLGLSPKHYFRYSWTNTMSLMTTKTNDSRIFLEYIYREAPFYLTRKFLVFKNWRESVYNKV